MSKPGLAFGLNLAKAKTKKPVGAKTAPAKTKAVFGGDESDDDGDDNRGRAVGPAAGAAVEEIGGDFDYLASAASPGPAETQPPRASSKTADVTAGLAPPRRKENSRTSGFFGDLSGSLSARKETEAAEGLDASVYEYDSVYDSLKPQKKVSQEEGERKSRYMGSLMQAAEVRKRDALIAEEKKLAREREAEGDEYEGKEKFVTEAYRRQQEENRRLEAEEKRKEEAEAKKNKGSGMAAFYKNLLDKDEKRHAEAVKAAEERSKKGAEDGSPTDETENLVEDQERAEAALARELNQKGASIAVNEDGQVVDRRQLLKGGLNVNARKKEAVQRETESSTREPDRRGFVGGAQGDRRQAMRERQSRMLEAQLEQSMKRSMEEEEARRAEVERAAKSRKTEGEISSARERYLARKRAAEEAAGKEAAAET